MLLYGVSQELHPVQTETVNNVLTLKSAKHVWDCLCWMQVVELNTLCISQCTVSSAKCEHRAQVDYNICNIRYSNISAVFISTAEHFQTAECQYGSTCSQQLFYVDTVALVLFRSISGI